MIILRQFALSNPHAINVLPRCQLKP